MKTKLLTASTRVALACGLFVLWTGDAWAQAVPVGQSVEQYTGSTRWPDVAYDSANGVYLVVWGNGTIRGRFVDDSGTAVGPAFQISDPSPYAQTPRVAYSPDVAAFLVVWQSSDGVTSNPNGTRVRGRMVSFTEGISADPPQAISNPDYTTRWEVGPAVAYSTASQQFLVAYNIFSATSAEIGARRVSTAAAPLGAEIGVTSSPDDYDREPAVGYFPSTDTFVVVWSGSGPSADFARARLYAASDGSPQGGEITIAESAFTYVPGVALDTLTGQLFVTWVQNDSASGGWRPFGNFLDDAGTVVNATNTRLSSTVGAYDANAVAYNVRTRTFFLVTHGSTEQDFGFEITDAGLPVAEAAAVTSVTAPNLTGAFNPRIGASALGPGWLVATAASFSSLWTQLITGTDLGGGGGPVIRKLTITPQPVGGTVTGGGLTCGSGGTTCQVTFDETTSVTLTAAPDAGFTLIGWGGSCAGTSTTATVEVSAVKTCRATFAAVWGGPNTEPSGCPATPAVVYAPAPGPIGASVSQYSGATQYPDVAYNQCQQVYLAVWSLGGTIRGRFIGDDGAGVGDAFYISTGQFAQTPKVVYNPNLGNFLVAWHSSASDSRTEIRSTVVTYPAGPASAGIVLSAPTYSSRWVTRPAIGYSTGSGRYLVAWSRYASSGADINARFVDTLNVPVDAEFPVSSTTDDYDREPTAGYFPDTNRFLLAWAGSGSAIDFVRGRLYDAATGAAYGADIPFVESIYTYVAESALNTETGNMFVVWMQNGPGGYRPYGRFVNGGGALVSTATLLSSTAGAYDANAIDYNPISRTFFLVTHGSAEQDEGFEIDGNGTPLGAATVVTSITQPGLTGAFNPRLAASRRQPRWLVGTAASFNSLWTQLIGGRQPSGIYQLTVTAPAHGTVSGSGISCGTGGSTCSTVFPGVTSASLTASPAPGFRFTAWGGDCSGTSVTTSVTVDQARTCTAGFAAAVSFGSDFSVDAKTDILWRHATNGQVWIWPMSGTTPVSETYVNTVPDTNWEIRAAEDFTGDGSADMVWRHALYGAVYLWTMNGTSLGAETYVGAADPAYDITSSGDYNGDGKADLLWRNGATGEVWIWFMNGAQILEARHIATVDPSYVVRRSGDLNGDGVADIVWQHSTLGQVWAWIMSATIPPAQVYVGTVPDTNYLITAVMDFSGDGKADLLWHHAVRGEVWMWTMDGGVRTAENWVGTVPDLNYEVVDSGDYDGDRKADVLWWNCVNGEVWIWLMDGPTRTQESWVATVPDTGYRIVK